MNNNLIILVVASIAGFTLWKLYWYFTLEYIRNLRRGGDKGRKCFEVQLASDTDDAPARITLVIEKLARSADADLGERRKGRGSVAFYIIGHCEDGETRARYIIECDEAEYPALKRVVKQQFAGYARISTPDLSHLDAITEGLREPASANQSFGSKAKKLIKSLQQ